MYVFICIDDKPYAPAVYLSAAVLATEFQTPQPQLDPAAGAMQEQNTWEIQLKQITHHTTQPVTTQYKIDFYHITWLESQTNSEDTAERDSDTLDKYILNNEHLPTAFAK